jgi:O-antigen/teichoic acid export membrane protein
MQVPTTTRTLRQRALRASTWTLAGHGLSQAIRLAGNLVMTRLLVPEMFGVMTIAYTLLFGVNLLSDLGLSQNIVQHERGKDPQFLNTAWVVQILRGVLIGAVIGLLAFALHVGAGLGLLPAGSVYADPTLPYVIATLSVTAIISGFESTKMALARRDLRVAQITRIELSSQVIGTVCMVIWALGHRSIWALVAGGVVSTFARTWLTHAWLAGPRNRWTWHSESFREIVAFGKWVFLSSVLGFLALSGDRLLLGGLVGADTLGLYSIAYLIVNSIQSALSRLASGVAFPALSEVARERRDQLGSTYYRVRVPFDAATLFLAGALYAAGSVVVQLLYDQRYSGAGAMVEVLAITLLATRCELANQCFLALGKPRLVSLLHVVRAIVLFIAVPAGFTWYGLTGGLWAIVLSFLSAIPVAMVLEGRFRLLHLRRELLLLPALPAGLLVGRVVVALVSAV